MKSSGLRWHDTAFPRGNMLPPLAEQRRTVAKFNRLLAMLDEMETPITASRATAEKLIEAVVAELTWPSDNPIVGFSRDQGDALMVAEPSTPFS